MVRVCAAGFAWLTLTATTGCGHGAHLPDAGTSAGTPPASTTTPAASSRTSTPLPMATTDIANPEKLQAMSQLIDDAIAAQRLPGAVVLVGHAGGVVFHRAFGSRKLPGEPGLDGAPAPAEPMTEDTLFDLASLTKSLATAPAVLQLVERGSVNIDDPLQTYLPGFNPANDPRRGRVTLRMLLTHTSGIAGDLSLDGPWGLDRADKAEGVRRALAAQVVFDPGEVFHYSDINFILLGALIEKITGEPLDGYVQSNVLGPLGMHDTYYLPPAKVCGPHRIRGTAIVVESGANAAGQCPTGTWSTDLLARVAPTSHDGDSWEEPERNPDFGHLVRGTVHDPTARRMGGVTGSAGLFATAQDVGRYAQALLDRRAGRVSAFPLQASTVELMTTPQQPGHNASQVAAANIASLEAIQSSPDRADPLLAPNYPAISGQDLRGLGWDIDTAHSRPRGRIFPIGGFGHTGFTGTTLWIDPGSDTYVVVLANVIHQPGGPPIASLSGDIATLTAMALGLYGS